MFYAKSALLRFQCFLISPHPLSVASRCAVSRICEIRRTCLQTLETPDVKLELNEKNTTVYLLLFECIEECGAINERVIAMESEQGLSAKNLQDKQIQNYWARDLARRVYLLRRQRKAILENCRRIAVVGASKDPNSESFLSTEKLLGMNLEIIPVFPGSESFLALRCYPRLREIPGKIDIVQVFTRGDLDLVELAREAVAKQVTTFWIEDHIVACAEVEEILSNGKVQLVEFESLAVEYLKHAPFAVTPSRSRREIRKAVKVSARMSKDPVSVKPGDGIQDAISKMELGHFRHLPVTEDSGRLIGMLSDRDIRLIRPSLAFVSNDDARLQLASLSVEQAAVFDPVKVSPETTLKETAELMLRWHVGGLPVVDHKDKLVGIITYTDLLREFVGNEA